MSASEIETPGAVGDLLDRGFVEVAGASDLWEGEMDAFDLGDREILIVRLADGFHAYDGICPHQSFSLVDGSLDAGVLTCRAHEWQFDAASGCGINPRDACLIRHATVVVDGVLHVSMRPSGHGSTFRQPTDPTAGDN